MARKSTSTGTPATLALARAAVPHTLHPYVHDENQTNFGLEAATELGWPAERVFKTLMVQLKDSLAVGIVPVSGSLDLKALAAIFGEKKASMADPSVAQRRTGYVLGGISPLGQKLPSPTVLDDSAFSFETILVSGGRRGLDVELRPQDLLDLTGGRRAVIAGN